MKFEIRQTTLNQAAQGSYDAMLVLCPQDTGEQGLLADWIASARRQGDFKDESGAILQSYGMAGIKARHVVAAADRKSVV